jgi:hypothetical protein
MLSIVVHSLLFTSCEEDLSTEIPQVLSDLNYFRGNGQINDSQ